MSHPDESPERNDGRSVRFETSAGADEPMKLVVKKTFIEVDDERPHEILSPGRRRATAPATPAFKFDGDTFIEDKPSGKEKMLQKRNLDVCNSEEAETVEGSTEPSNLSSNTSSWDGKVDGDSRRPSRASNQSRRKLSAMSQNTQYGEPGTDWLNDDEQHLAADAHATELELHAAELKLEALRAEAAAQRARQATGESRTRPSAQAQPFMPGMPAMPPGGMDGYAMGMFPVVPPFLSSTVPMWQYSNGDASTRNPGMPPMPFDPMFGQPYAMPHMPPHGQMPGYNPKQRRAWENYQRQQASQNGSESKPKRGDDAVKADEDYTTVMLRNMPCDYTRDMLVEVLELKGFTGKFDFLYVPFDFKKQAGLGYAFMNLITHEDAMRAMNDLQGFSQWAVPTQKVMQVSWSTPLQGLAANIERYRNSPVMHPEVPERFKPLLFKHGKSVRFPPPTKPLQQPELRGLV